MKAVKKNFSFCLNSLIMLAVIIWSLGGVSFYDLTKIAKAATSYYVSDEYISISGYPGYPISTDSSPKEILRFDVYTDQSSVSLASTTVSFNGTGFSTTTLADVSTASTSGVSIYFDGDDDKIFDPTIDSLLGMDSAPTWLSTSTIFINDFNSNNGLTQNATSSFFVVIRTSSGAADGTEIYATLPSNSVVTNDGYGPTSGFTSSNYTVDTTGPSITSVQKVSSSAVEVNFNEMIYGMTSQNTAYYSFNGDINVTNVMQQGPTVIRVEADDLIEAGVTTLTVSNDLTDLAGNANTSTGAQAITQAVKIKISEISADTGSDSAEFIELYNAGESSVDISGWLIQYSAAGDGSTWSNLATIPGSTSIAGYSFYLLSTSAFDSVSSIDGDINYTASLDLTGGHVRIYNNSSEIDKIGWGSAINPEGIAISAHSSGQSLERKALGDSNATMLASGGIDNELGNSWDTGSNNFDFVVQANIGPQNSNSAQETPDFEGMIGGGLMINHMPINSAATGADLEVLAQMGDPMTPIDEVMAKLFYAEGDGSPENNVIGDYTAVVGAHQSNGYFKFTIPQATVDASTGNGLYYYLKLITDSGNQLMSNSYEADISGTEDLAAQNPFIVGVAAAGTNYDISGTVLDPSNTGTSSVLVFLEGTGYSTSTDESGNYTISAPNGVYNLVMTKTGYYEEWINDVFVNGANINLASRTLVEGTGGGITGDNTKPIVTWTGPPDGMIGIPALEENFEVFVGFSKDMDSSTFTSQNIYYTIDGSATITPATIIYDNDNSDNISVGRPNDPYLGVVYPPSGGFLENKTYYLVMTGNIRDTAGNSLQGNRTEGGHVVSFSSGADYSSEADWDSYGTGEMMPPFVFDTKPSNGALNVATNTKINITFSEPMDASTVTQSGNIKLYKVNIVNNAEQLTAVSISVSMDTSNSIAIITPQTSLSSGKYRIVVSGALKSSAGIWMGDPTQDQNTSSYSFYKSSFEIGSTGDNTAPTILGNWPSNNDTNIPVNPGALFIQFSENINPATINANTINLKRGSSLVTTNLEYDSMGYSANIVPSVVLATNVIYTLTITGGSSGIADMAGNYLASTTAITFTTSSSGDTQDPEIMFANGDEYSIAITFSEPMKAVKVTDTANWAQSVLNPNNYIIKWGDPGTVAASGQTIDLAALNSTFAYDYNSNTVIIENFGLDSSAVTDKDFYINMGSGSATDLSGNLLASSSYNTFQMPINNSADTGGILGPATSGTVSVEMSDMGMMKAGAFPMNSMAGQNTIYFIDIPTTKAIPAGGKISLIFPTGFNVANAKKDTSSSINNDINEYNAGTVSFSTAVESSGGANNDGVIVDSTTRKITITTAGAATQTNDYLHMDIAGIVNSSIPRGYETSGYIVDIKTYDASGNLLESISGMPFYITEGGSASLTVTIAGVQAADVDGTNDTVSVFLGSPMTGPMEAVATIANDGTGTATFNSLPTGQYYIFTDPLIILDNNDYSGMPNPEPITINTGVNNKTLTLSKEEAAVGKATITVNITGSFGTDDIDVFAGSPSSFRVKTLESAGNNPSAQLYLSDGTWMVGMGPAVPAGITTENIPMPDWMSPKPIEIKVSGNGTVVTENSGTANDGTIALTVSSASKQIVGYVYDGSGNPIANAEAWAYQPMGDGMGANTQTDVNGKFILKVDVNGKYSVGVFKSGLPSVPEKSVTVSDNSGAADDNSSADISYNGNLITTANKLSFKIKKGGYTISGKVTDGTNPVAYAPVWANQSDGYMHADTMTDSSGNYILYVDNGSWVVSAYIPNYGDADQETVVINGSNETQNLAPNNSLTYYTISGTVDIDNDSDFSDDTDNPLSFMPIRAVEYNAQGVYQGKEYSSMTDSSGNYSINVPAGIYRVDIWTSEYGELGINNLNNNDTLNEAADDSFPTTPANVDARSSNVTNADIIIVSGNLRTISLGFDNAYANQEGFLSIEGIDGSNEPTGYRFATRISDLSATSTIQVNDGDYLFFLDVPGLGSYIPTLASRQLNSGDGSHIIIDGDRSVYFTLDDVSDSSVAATISGTITDGSNPVSDAWVWIGNPDNGYNNGTQSASDGTYSLTVPLGSDYKIGADKPGYMSLEPSDLDVTGNTTKDFTLVINSLTISGYIYKDANSNNQYDNGEGVANGFVRAETTDGAKKSYSPADGNGYFELGVVDGTWKLYGMADGYEESLYGSNVSVSGSDTNANIKLTVNSSWTTKSKKKPITPASGGTMDDTAPGGTGVKLTMPPNALGNSSSAGNINANVTGSVTKTNSSDPVGGKGVNITATDNSGQAITNLNDYVDFEIVLYKSDVDTGLADETLTYSKLKNTKNGYWDSGTNDWINLNTTRKAYYKNNADDTEWTLYTNSAASNPFNAFIDSISSSNYADYKLVYTSKTNHFTIFAIIMPFVATPVSVTPSPSPSPSPTVSGGTPANILSQINDALQSENNNDESVEEINQEESTQTTEEPITVSPQDTVTVSADELYKNEAEMIARAEVAEILPTLGLERNHELEKQSREMIISKMGVFLGSLEPRQQYALTNFVAYGSQDTQKLGSGERAGVINSFQSAFGKIPESESDWQDVIKIANGRWPNQRNNTTEANAEAAFRKIYLRSPDRSNPNDDAAVTVIAYGLRPANRNMDSEKAAIKSFRAIYGYYPSSATAWDIVRAIAYSGASR